MSSQSMPTTERIPDSSRSRNLAGFVFLAGALFCWGWSASRGWEIDGLAVHEFRQSQTALSIQAMQRDGFRLDYATPVLGKPWSIPMEFPLYQGAVVIFCDVFGADLVQGGRWVSAICFLMGIPALVLILREARFSWGASTVGVVPVVMAPIYLFFSRTVMIESMAWAAAAWFLVGILWYRRTGTLGSFALALAAGAGAVLIKSTTWAAFCIPWAILFIFDVLRGLRGRNVSWRNLMGQALGIGVPLLAVGFWWVAKADSIKAQNPMADFLVSSELTGFNFGSWNSRKEIENWQSLWAAWEYALVPWWVMALATVGALGLKRSRVFTGLAPVGFLGTQSLFFGLYLKHDYYFYANGAMAGVLVGGLIAAIWDYSGKKVIGMVFGGTLTLAVGALEYAHYRAGYWTDQVAPMRGGSYLADAIKIVTQPDDVVVIQAPDWNSVIALQAERKILTIPDFRMFLHPEKVKESVTLLSDESVPLVVVMPESQIHASWVADRIDDFGLWPAPLFETGDGTKAYARADQFETMRSALETHPVFGVKLVAPEPLAPRDKRIVVRGTAHEKTLQALEMPILALVSPLGVNAYVDEGELRLATHASTEVYLEIPPDATGVSFNFGVNPNSLAEKDFDGFIVQLELVHEGDRHERIYTEWMSPHSTEATRQVEVDFGGKTAPVLVYRVMNGPRNDPAYDQVWLNKLVFHR